MQYKLNVLVAAAVTLFAGAVSAQEVVKIGHVAPTSGGIAHPARTTRTARAWPSTN